MIRVYWLDVRNVNPERVRHLMSPSRLEKLDAMRHADGRRQSAAAEIALVLAMAHEQHRAPRREIWRALPGGKPVIDGGLHFSISHSGDVAVCAISEQVVGADVERARQVSSAMRRKILSGREHSVPDEALLRLWVAKESFLKMTGEGLKRPMTGFSVEDGMVFSEDGAILAHVRRAKLPMEGYELCVCSPRTADITVMELDLTMIGPAGAK